MICRGISPRKSLHFFCLEVKVMERNNVSRFKAVVKHIEEVLQDNPTINMVSVTVDMGTYPTRAKVCYASDTIADVRLCEIEVR